MPRAYRTYKSSWYGYECRTVHTEVPVRVIPGKIRLASVPAESGVWCADLSCMFVCHCCCCVLVLPGCTWHALLAVSHAMHSYTLASQYRLWFPNILCSCKSQPAFLSTTLTGNMDINLKTVLIFPDRVVPVFLLVVLLLHLLYQYGSVLTVYQVLRSIPGTE